MSDTYGFDFAERTPEEAREKIKALTVENAELDKRLKDYSGVIVDLKKNNGYKDRDIERLTNLVAEREKEINSLKKALESMSEKKETEKEVVPPVMGVGVGFVDMEYPGASLEEILRAAKRAGCNSVNFYFIDTGDDEE